MLTFLGFEPVISNKAKDIKESSHIILPGVGAFGTSMEKIVAMLPCDILENEVVKKGKPFLGICVGMQVLANKGMEFGEHDGLGWISGIVEKFPIQDLPLPHMGWNNIVEKKRTQLLNNLKDFRDFYFVHSYVFEVENEDNVIAQTEYGITFNSIIQADNIYGIQFHPEKSQKAGQLIIKNFMELA